MKPAEIAEAYIHVLYSGDDDLARQLYLFHSPNSRQDERKVKLVSLTVKPLTPKEAGDKNPVTDWQYFQVETVVNAEEREGKGKYTVGLVPMPQVGDKLRVNMISGGIVR